MSTGFMESREFLSRVKNVCVIIHQIIAEIVRELRKFKLLPQAATSSEVEELVNNTVGVIGKRRSFSTSLELGE